MGMFDHFPYTNFHEMNLDWILQALKEIEKTMDQFVTMNAIKYADPIQWNITKQYEKNTVVIDGNTGTAYLSVQAVPKGIALANTDYWTVIFTLDILASNHNITAHDAGGSLTATFPSDEGDWILWNAILYKATRPIVLHEAYLVGYNLTAATVDDFVHEYITALTNDITALANKVGDLTDLDTTNKTDLVKAINEVLATIGTVAGNLTDLDTTDKSNLVSAINEVLSKIGTVAGNLTDLNTTDKSNLVNAINEVNTAVAQEITNRTNADRTIIERLNNLNVKNARDYGATGDGVTDDATALQAWLNDLTAADLGYLPAGNYLIRSPLVAPNIDNLSIKGAPNAKILANFATGDIIVFGGTPRKRHLFIDGLWIDGSITHTSGAAIKIIGYCNYNKIMNIKIGDYGSGSALLYDGIVFERTHVCHFENFNINVNNDGLRVYGDPSGVYSDSSDLFVNNGSILHCPVGLHIAGGFGGLYLDNLLIFGGKTGYKQNNSHCTLANREIFFSNTVCIDGSDSQLIDIDESGNGSFIEINAFLSGAGFYAPTAEQQYACNIRIASAPNATIIISNCVNKASTQFGVYLNEATARVIIGSTCVIRDCVVGVNNVANSSYIYCEAVFINNSNTDFYGSYNPTIKPYPQPVAGNV